MATIEIAGDNPTRIWGMTNRQRTRRIIAAAELASPPGRRQVHIIANDDFVFDPLLLHHLLAQGQAVVVKEGVPVLCVLEDPSGAGAVAAAMRGEQPLRGDLARIEVGADFTLYNHKLRKRERPLLMRLDGDTVRSVERATYFGAYKGVTDILTKYLWPEWALVLTRIAAQLGMSPNLVTAIGALHCVAAAVCFWYGSYWSGMLLGLIFMVLDTVDGKLARCTVTSSRLGDILDHGIDLIHPPFWWWAWAHGLGAWGLSLPPALFGVTIVAIVAGYVLERLIERNFRSSFGFHIHVWRKADSSFRLITARRNPNMIILFVSTVLQRPDIGIVAVAAWTWLCLLFHAVRLAQARSGHHRGIPIVSWLS